jgi:hypothetical protein
MPTKYSGADWIEGTRKHWKNQDKPMSELGRKVADLLGQAYEGIYHLPDNTLEKANWSGEVIEITIHDGHQMATYDADTLTVLVLLCHWMNVRLRIKAAARVYLRLVFQDVERTCFFREGHPTLDEAIERVRELYVEETPCPANPPATTTTA